MGGWGVAQSDITKYRDWKIHGKARHILLRGLYLIQNRVKIQSVVFA